MGTGVFIRIHYETSKRQMRNGLLNLKELYKLRQPVVFDNVALGALSHRVSQLMCCNATKAGSK